MTLYLGAMELKLNTTSTTISAQTVTGTRYYSHNGQTVAMRTTTGVTWLAGGQNGTAELAVNASTSALTQRRTMPFGEQRGTKPTWPGEQGFVGGTMDATTGLTHLGAREYDPASGRFLSVDPIIDFSDPQQLHGYAYGRNNPLSFPDPTGLHWGWSDWGHAALDVVGLVPVFGEWADAINGVWYAAEGDWVNAGLSFAAVIPVAGYAASAVKGAKYVDEAVDVVKATDKALESADTAADATKAADNLTPPATPKTNPAPTPDPPATPKNPDGGGSKANDGSKADSGGKTDAGSKADSGGGCKHSFAATTFVLMADGSTKAIDQIQPGDQVMATDPTTGETIARTVEATHINLDHELTDLTVKIDDQASGSGDATAVVLHTTQNHPFYSETRHQWIDAANLQPGEKFRTTNGAEATVGTVASYTSARVMHDLTITEIHTYYVLAGNTPVLVHNCQVDYGSTDLSQAVIQERLKLGKNSNNFAAARYTDSSGAEQVMVAFSSKGRGNHAEQKLIRAIGKSNISEIYSELQPCRNSCAPAVAGIKTSWSWNWTTSVEGAVSRKSQLAAVRQVFADALSGNW